MTRGDKRRNGCHRRAQGQTFRAHTPNTRRTHIQQQTLLPFARVKKSARRRFVCNAMVPPPPQLLSSCRNGLSKWCVNCPFEASEMPRTAQPRRMSSGGGRAQALQAGERQGHAAEDKAKRQCTRYRVLAPSAGRTLKATSEHRAAFDRCLQDLISPSELPQRTLPPAPHCLRFTDYGPRTHNHSFDSWDSLDPGDLANHVCHCGSALGSVEPNDLCRCRFSLLFRLFLLVKLVHHAGVKQG